MLYVLIKHFMLIYVLTHAVLFMMSVVMMMMMMMIPFDEDNKDNKSGYASGETYGVINKSLNT